MPNLINTRGISWKVWALVAVLGGTSALGGSFYAGKWLGSSQPPTVIRMPPRMMPIPIIPEPKEMSAQPVGARAPSETRSDSESRPHRLKRMPLPTSLEKRSLGTDTKNPETNNC